MAYAQLSNISKEYQQVKVVNDLSLNIYQGEIFAIVGPSGCGKTTLLQIIAGLVKADAGSFTLAGKLMSSVDENIYINPEKRSIAMVFQDYALWPHYNVFGNIAYPLKIKKYSHSKQKQVVGELLELVRLQGMERRYPHELSGGEQQRVALARALALKPMILLLDESLSNLDANLKKEMQEEIKRIQRDLLLTVIHVTHDQQEAMSIADRIAIMNQGELVQVGTIEEVYRFPRTEFVARFMGDSNLICPKQDNPAEMKLWKMAGQNLINGKAREFESEQILVVRSEDIKLSEGSGHLTGQIITKNFNGSVINYKIKINDYILKVQAMADSCYEPGQEVSFSIMRATCVCADNS